MTSSRKNAIIVGVLFIAATVFGVIAAAIYSPIVNAPDYLLKLSENEDQIVLVSILEFFMAMSCAGIGIALYPIFKKYNEGQAIGIVGFRIIESMTQVLLAVMMISLLALSREYVNASAPPDSFFQTAGAILKAGSDWLSNGAMLIPWCIAALMYYSVFYKSRLIPRWISGWGLIGITLTIISSVLVMFDPALGTIQTFANIPIAIQEMVMAVWLIVKGFNVRTV